MRVDHRGADILVAEQLLDGPDVVTLLEQVGGKRVTEGVARGRLGNPGTADRILHGALEDGFVEMVAAALAREAIHI